MFDGISREFTCWKLGPQHEDSKRWGLVEEKYAILGLAIQQDWHWSSFKEEGFTVNNKIALSTLKLSVLRCNHAHTCLITMSSGGWTHGTAHPLPRSASKPSLINLFYLHLASLSICESNWKWMNGPGRCRREQSSASLYSATDQPLHPWYCSKGSW